MSTTRPGAVEDALTFGPFSLRRSAKILREGDSDVHLGEAIFAVLAALVERAGEQVTPDELIVYSGRAHGGGAEIIEAYVRILCRRLGLDPSGRAYITRRSTGYCFGAAVSRQRVPSTPALRVVKARNNLPGPGDRLVGRDDDVRAIAEMVDQARFVTVVGAPGVGKSAVAVATAEGVSTRFADGVCFVDLGVVKSPEGLAAAVAIALGVGSLAEDPLPTILAHLRDKQCLLVLDDCAGVAEAAPGFAGRLLEACPGVRCLTSAPRPLGAPDERVYRLQGLPGETGRASPAATLMKQRRIERLMAPDLSDMDLYPYGRLVEALAGAPLSIELVAAAPPEYLDALAARIPTYGGDGLGLDAVLAWSLSALDEADAAFLRQLAAFNGFISLAAAQFMAEICGVADLSAVMGRLAGMHLVTRDVVDGVLLYRLHAAVRDFALSGLQSENDYALVRRRHAEVCNAVLKVAEGDWDELGQRQWVERYGYVIHDLRSAIDWCMSVGDRPLGVALTAAAVPLAVQLSLTAEFRGRVKLALDVSDGWRRSPILQMRLNTAFANLAQLTWGTGAEATAAFSKAHELAERVGIASEQASTLLGVWSCAFGKADYPAAAEFSNRLSMVAKVSSEPFITLLGDRTSAQAQHFLGRHDRARILAERVINYPQRSIPLSMSMPGVSRQVSMRIIMARILWIQGHPDQAEEMVEAAISHAAADLGIAMCHALALAAAPVALWRGDEARAQTHIDRLLDLSSAAQANYWRSWAQRFEEVLRWRQTGVAVAPPQDAKQADAMATFAEVFVTPGVLARVEAGLVGWCAPEVFRAEGERLLGQGEHDGAETSFKRALNLSRRHRATGWELRAASSLARLWNSQGLADEAEALLAPIVEGFSEGHATADLRAAHEVLAKLNRGGVRNHKDGRPPRG